MSAVIHHFVVHQLRVNDEGKIVLVPREQCLDISPELEHLGHQINHTFNSKPGKGVGHFIDDGQSEPEFANDLATYYQAFETSQADSDSAFLAFSLSASEKLVAALVDTGQVETGFVIFTHYEFLATQYLMITLLNTKAHVEVNQALELTSREHLDLARMQLAVRFDLTQWRVQPEQERFISFIKGRMGRKVSDFFMQFIQCEERVDVKQQNKQLVTSVENYLASEQLDAAEKQVHRDEVKNYYKEKIDSGESLDIKELAAKLPADLENKHDFMSFTEGLETPLEPEIQPDPTALRQLAKFSGQGGGVSVSFERKLLGERVYYDPATDTLTIRGIPPNLKDQLSKQS
jgi:nucleoid-associated protein